MFSLELNVTLNCKVFLKLRGHHCTWLNKPKVNLKGFKETLHFCKPVLLLVSDKTSKIKCTAKGPMDEIEI